MSSRKLVGSEIFCNYGETGSEKLYKKQKTENSKALSTIEKVAIVGVAAIVGAVAAVLIAHLGFDMPFSCLNNIGVALIGGTIGGICAYAVIKILEILNKKSAQESSCRTDIKNEKPKYKNHSDGEETTNNFARDFIKNHSDFEDEDSSSDTVESEYESAEEDSYNGSRWFGNNYDSFG